MQLNFYYENRSKFIYIVLLAFLLVSKSFALAQTGTIKGTVTDKTTKDALVGANILVHGTNLGAAADIDGNFIIHNVAEGSQVLDVSYIGYKNLSVTINVAANKTSEVNINLEAVAIEGKTVIVTAQARGQLQAINQQLSSNNIVNIVSSEKMQELPDANIAESIGRLPGISLQRNAGEANQVVIRGLSPQFNEVSIEGVPMSSTNYPSMLQISQGNYQQDRSIDLSILSDNMVQGVEVSKTLRPDMDANALGGTINLTLKTAQPGLHFNLAGNGAYNHLRDTYNNYKFFGSVSDRFLDDKIGVLLQGNVEEKQLPSDQFNSSYTTNVPTSVNTDFYVTTSNAQLTDNNTKRQRYGISLVLDYTSDFVDLKFFNLYDSKVDSTITRYFQTNFANNSFLDQFFLNRTKTEQRTHSLQALFKFAGTELPVSVSYTKGNQSTPNGQEFDFLQSGALQTAISTRATIYAQPASLLQTMGVMDAANVNTTLQYLYQTNTSLADNSYDAKIDWKIPFKISDSFSGKLSTGGKYRETNRNSDNTRVYYNIQYGGSQGRRDTLVNNISYLRGTNSRLLSGLSALPFLDPGYNKSNILGYRVGPGFNVYQLSDLLNTITARWSALYYDDGVGDHNQDYDFKEKTLAGYFMGEFNIGNDLSITAGARWQQEQTEIAAYHVQVNGSNQNGLAGQAPQLINTKRDNPDWFPSLNIKYKANDNIQILGAVYKSATLPSFSDITPLVIYQANQQIISGNPLLKPSTAWNLDLGASLFNNEIGLFTANIFYKEIKNLIYGMQNYFPFAPYPLRDVPSDIASRLPGKSYYDTTWAQSNNGLKLTVNNIPMNDPSTAFLRGLELSWQTHLWYLPGVLSGIVIDLNASWMSSRQDYPSFKIVGPTVGNKDTLVYISSAGPLQNQPKAIYNAVLGWDYKGFSSRFSFRYQQITLSSMDARYNLQNFYNDNITLLDISLKQQIMNNFAVYANATNINNHIDNSYFSHPAYTTSNISIPAGQLPTSGQTYSWIIQLGISYNY